ncbi:glycosyltransferase family 4 protein [Poseidonibacter antarcticus]|uniref:glycosyltransferase family 4 protein n=1 Tax=Poseidonibacter antarcticus TaxID=2478538 RepID=UPI000EF53BCB|nr:glycosyltransferase family 4 protein [Poseidonibacter antarcticus]
MQKFLYITDQDEYTEHSFIGPLFEKYLNKHFDINIIYFSHHKEDSEIKDGNKFIIPNKYRNDIISQLEKNNINLNDYAYITVRNDAAILKDVIKKRHQYNYKVGFRLSFPKRIAKLQIDEANNKKSFFDIINNKVQTYKETSLINECDIFLPTSRQMRDDYLKDVKTRTFVIPSAIDPDLIQQNIHHKGEEKRFFYAGTLDKLREFETVLKAFSQIPSDRFKLMVSTKDPQYAKEMFDKYPELTNSIEIYEAKTRQDLIKLIAKADIGLAPLPNIELFNSSTPMKILDYYSSAIPCVMTNNENNNSIFTDDENAWLCDFTQDAIREKLEYIINLSKDEITLVGENGQKRLLDVRNYDRIAADLAHQLNIL